MNLTRDTWTIADYEELSAYLATLGKGEEKAKWEARVLNTAMPTIAVPAPEIKRVVRAIAKGNVRDYVALWRYKNYTEFAVLGQLLCHLPFAEAEPLLLRYAEACDTWAGTDCLWFDRATHAEYLAFAARCLPSPHPFVRRLGLIVMLKIIDDDTINAILGLLPALETEQEYYVNMAVAWLVAECFVKFRARTLAFLDEGRYNVFVSRKAVSKCRDSYRVTPEDKEMLLQYRKK